MGRLQAIKRRDEAIAALAAAKSDTDRKKATTELEAASLALASFGAKSGKDDEPKKPLAEEEEEEEEEESDDEEEEEEEESEEDDDDSDDDSDDDDDDDDEEEEEAKEDEHCKEQALASAKALLASAKTPAAKKAAKENLVALKAVLAPRTSKRTKALRETAARVTGKKSTKAIVAALDGLAGAAAATEALAKTVKRMQSTQKRDRISSMLSRARREGKITSEQSKQLAKGKNEKWLKSYLAVLPAQVRTVERGALQGRTQNGGRDGDDPNPAAGLAHIDAQNLDAEQRKMLERQAVSAGKSFDEFITDMNATLAKHGALGASRN